MHNKKDLTIIGEIYEKIIKSNLYFNAFNRNKDSHYYQRRGKETR